jgi:hypothetical protein
VHELTEGCLSEHRTRQGYSVGARSEARAGARRGHASESEEPWCARSLVQDSARLPQPLETERRAPFPTLHDGREQDSVGFERDEALSVVTSACDECVYAE